MVINRKIQMLTFNKIQKTKNIKTKIYIVIATVPWYPQGTGLSETLHDNIKITNNQVSYIK